MSVTVYSRVPDSQDPSGYDFDGPNFANGNWHAIMTFIGMEPECEGVADPDDFISRCATARAVGGVGFQDTGSPAVRYGNVIESARRPGYFTDAIAEIEARAIRAKADGHVVVWA